MPTNKVLELTELLRPEDKAAWVARVWDNYNSQRQKEIKRWKELDAYVTATDTSTTSNNESPWTHNSVLPKITQIRDNLHANYISSLFPNDKWLTWLAYSEDAAKQEVAKTMQSYMENKTREGKFRGTISQLLLDYIDHGNAFAMPIFEARYKEFGDQKVAEFVGPKLVRISPYDIVFNPIAVSFEKSFKVVRSVKTIGEIKRMIKDLPDAFGWQEALDRRDFILQKIRDKAFTREDWAKAEQYTIDGFGNLQEYYQSNTVEVLEFYGDYHDATTGELYTNRMITVVDRSVVVRDTEVPSYGGDPLIRHVGWRNRPGNLWAMGPLDNLVGLQYLLNHYMNMGANALDLKVMPPKKIIGEVEEFVWGPNEEIHLDENGDVQEMAQNFNDVFTVKDWMEYIEAKMEMYAGAPREAMGIRTPGEKTMFEVQALENAAGRIFQEKIVQFEVFMEECLNDMVEVAHRNFDKTDIISIIDNDIGVQQFKQITKDDLSANGILRPVGARHFAQRAQELQNIVGIFNGPIGNLITPHTSTTALARFIEDAIDLRGYNIFQKNVAVQEQQQLQSLMDQAQADNAAMTPDLPAQAMTQPQGPKQ